MAFFTQRTGRGRQKTITARLSAAQSPFNLPRGGSDIGGLLGVGEPSWSWINAQTGKGVIGTTSDVRQVGFLSRIGNISAVQCNAANLSSDLSFESGVSLCYVVICRCVGNATDGTNGSFGVGSGNPRLNLIPYLDGFVLQTLTPDSASTVTAKVLNGNIAGSLCAVLVGWDARTRKPFGAKLTGVEYGNDTVSSAWASVSSALLNLSATGSIEILQAHIFRSVDAESLADKLVSSNAILNLLVKNVFKGVVSSSAVIVTGIKSYVTNADDMPASESGLVIHSAITNLFAHSYKMNAWTGSGLSLTEWKSFDTCALRTLSRLAETAVDDEHKITLAVTPAATGRHWLECTVRHASISAAAISIDNGTDSAAISFDIMGAETGYASIYSEASVEVLDYRLFRVKMPIDLSSTDPCTITLRGLRYDDTEEQWVDSYLGVATRELFAGQWSFCVSELAPLALPVSLGTASTAIAPIIDWTDSKALNRLKNGRLTARLRVLVAAWLAEDYVLWTWRKDANNAVEVWVRYKATQDNRLLYWLELVSIAAGTSTVIELDTGDWVLESPLGDEYRCREMTVSVVIDSAGVVRWWARPEPVDGAIPGYEIPNKQTGKQTIAGFTAFVPTSIRLGSSAAGTGQQPMTIKEVSTW